METLLGSTVVKIALAAVGAAVAFVILRAMLRVAARFLAIGCLSLAALALVVWLVGWMT
ncbi:MAG: hypothetical protein AB1449_13785 [Chloroflexota bacterium]